MKLQPACLALVAASACADSGPVETEPSSATQAQDTSSDPTTGAAGTTGSSGSATAQPAESTTGASTTADDSTGSGSGSSGPTTDDGTECAAHVYFDALRMRPQSIRSAGLRSSSEIDQFHFGDVQASPVAFDAEQDACRWPFPAGVGSYFHGQLRVGHPPVSSGRVLYYWEAKWSEGWADYANFPGQNEHKAFQLARDASGDPRRFETQIRYATGATPLIDLEQPQVAHITMRIYEGGGVTYPGPDQPLAGQLADFVVHAERWIQLWQEVDIDNATFSFWVADAEQGTVQLMDKLQLTTVGDLPFDTFWWEWNASIGRSAGPELPVYGRNLVVLHNADAQELVQANCPPEDG